jgi:hypothetical protein
LGRTTAPRPVGLGPASVKPRSLDSSVLSVLKQEILFFFLGGVSEILRFDLHFVFVLSLDCDNSWPKEGVVKIFGFDF